MTEEASGTDERRSLKKLKYRLLVGQKLVKFLQIKYILLLENLFDMVNRRDSVVSCRC